MTTLTMRLVKGDFIVTGPDVEPEGAFRPNHYGMSPRRRLCRRQ